MNKVGTGLLITAIVAAPVAANRLAPLFAPAFMKDEKVEECLPTLPEKGVKKVGEVAVGCEKFGPAFPFHGILNGMRVDYDPGVNPLMAVAINAPDLEGHPKTEGRPITLVTRKQFKVNVAQAREAYSKSRNIPEDIFHGEAALAMLVGGFTVLNHFKRRGSSDPTPKKING